MSDFVDFNLSDIGLDAVGTWDGNYQLITPAEYSFEVTHVEQVQTGTGNAGVKFTFSVVDSETDQDGKTLKKTYSLKQDPKVLARFKNVIVALGVDPNNINGGELLGRRMLAEVYHKPQTNVAQTAPDGTPLPEKMTMDIRGERPVEGAAVETPPPPPPPTTGKKVGAVKNGSAAARR